MTPTENSFTEAREDVALRLVFQKFERRLEALRDLNEVLATYEGGTANRNAVHALDDAESDLKLSIADYNSALADAVASAVQRTLGTTTPVSLGLGAPSLISGHAEMDVSIGESE